MCPFIMGVSAGVAQLDSHDSGQTMERSSVALRIGGAEEEAVRAAAFRRLAETHLTNAYRLARMILRDPTEAQDAVHDAFVTAWRKWSTLRDPDKFVPWFDRIVVNTCRNRLRSRSRWNAQTDVAELQLAIEDPHEATHDRQLVGAAFVNLSADDRIVIALRYYRDLQVDDIARLLEVRPGTVKSRLHRAQRRLRTIMEANGTQGPNG